MYENTIEEAQNRHLSRRLTENVDAAGFPESQNTWWDQARYMLHLCHGDMGYWRITLLVGIIQCLYLPNCGGKYSPKFEYILLTCHFKMAYFSVSPFQFSSADGQVVTAGRIIRHKLDRRLETKVLLPEDILPAIYPVGCVEDDTNLCLFRMIICPKLLNIRMFDDKWTRFLFRLKSYHVTGRQTNSQMLFKIVASN